jgi:hypothetical protein
MWSAAFPGHRRVPLPFWKGSRKSWWRPPANWRGLAWNWPRTGAWTDAEAIARAAMAIAADICVHTNGNLTVERIGA